MTGIRRNALFLGLVALATVIPLACGRGGEEAQVDETWEGDLEAATRPLRPQEGTAEDWAAMKAAASWAWEEGLDTVPMGEAVARIGLSFVGTPYGAGTLEVAGEEGVVINFQEFDCVTFVENSLALARFLRLQEPEILDSDLQTRNAYRGTLREIRYRGGRVDGYPSRLHYFSEWIEDNQSMGIVQDVTPELGGEEDIRVVDFMSQHPAAYRQLADPANLQAVLQTETALNRRIRYKLPEEAIPTWASWIRNGDIIAATSTVEGLDVAHTGLALWQDGELHLLHAPLVGGNVEVSRRPLGERILRIEGQDGIRVARPLAPGEGSGGGAGE